MAILIPRREESHEILDEQSAPIGDVQRSLRDLRRINRYLGGLGMYRLLVQKFSPRSIVDVGAGTCDQLDSVPHIPLRVGVDFNIAHLLYLRDGSRVHRVVADAQHLPFRDGAVDLITSSHFFHHFTPEENVSVLGESLRVARGVAITDTRRHYLPLLFVALLGKLRLVGRVTALDAPASVRQGYTVGEVEDIASRVRASEREMMRRWPFRWALLLWK
jgi:ubiquinone/menaquinone biosynthesis C-methylase UbiE